MYSVKKFVPAHTVCFVILCALLQPVSILPFAL